MFSTTTLSNHIDGLALGFRAWRYRAKTDIYQWIAHRLPARLRYFAAIDVGAYASTGRYGNTIVPDLTVMDAIDRFARDKGVN